ncbi:tetratricopeptide (TPR) repeat protein [Streptomyces sp. SAI-144]|uniref:tetratricopeptide repeat protein n=1 Tax=unclassified Streptomyces TaxID=2593676 RepID=UPI002473249C|nr:MULTISPECIES: tetratricopeptide repeat protein [unclassified Streptomyces]MDH6434608.1 tetratricopeptide (TPR) repeat protein [Streptomyces sp. SAI-144]MDH6490018.1 tetratricopeptide (TPR) repeat protein [Streptomyces sp. SAI-127]
MASSMVTSSQSPTPPQPNLAFRRLRGQRSPAEFAAAVRRAAREIGERVSCDARYVGRVEAGEIRCPNYAYERVFLHMFPGRTLTDLGFAPRASVRGRRARPASETEGTYEPYDTQDTQDPDETYDNYEESDVLRRAFMTGGGATVAAASLGPLGLAADATAAGRPVRRAGTGEAGALEEAVRRIRLLDDRHGADGLYRRAAAPLRAAYALLDAGATRQTTADRLHSGAGELAISVGWLAHDSGRFDDARSHYAEALATARVTGDDALEAHAFCNTAFLARDAGRPREAVRAAQAAQRVARSLGSPRLMSLLALREAGGWAGLADRTGCEQALARAQAFFERGLSDADPEWMSFYGEAELEGLEAQCWSTLGDWRRAARHAGRAADLQDPHFTRNIALYTAELADDLARGGHPDESAAAGLRVLELLGEVQSSRIQTMLAGTARVLLPHRRASGVSAFLERHASTPRTA